MKDNTCCFFGHRKIACSPELKAKIANTIETLIRYDNIDTFLFGSKSEFDTLCHDITSSIKKIYPHIKRVYVRAEYPDISDTYKAHLLESYEDTYFPSKIINAGRAAYVERNQEMIDNSKICITYYDPSYTPSHKKTSSGTKLAYDYALRRGLKVINVSDM